METIGGILSSSQGLCTPPKKNHRNAASATFPTEPPPAQTHSTARGLTQESSQPEAPKKRCKLNKSALGRRHLGLCLAHTAYTQLPPAALERSPKNQPLHHFQAGLLLRECVD